jgi:hypothetical protein
VAFKGTVKLPQELIDAGATVSIRYAVSGLGDGDTFDAVPGKNFQWKLEVNGFESGYKTTSVACDGILEVTTADYCEMEIQVPDVCPQCPEAEACANPEDCQVPIEVAIRYSKFGWLGNGAKVILPKGINIQWKLRVNGFQSGYQSKPVDCTALVVPEGDLCCMHIEMPQDLQEAGGQVAIRYSEFGWLDHCKCVCLPKGINIQWKLKVNGFESGYKSKPVDCTPIVVEDADWCLMKIQIPDGAQVAIRYSSFGWMGDGTEVYLPQGINIQWKIYIDGAWSGYNTKKIDCSPLVYP